MSLKTYYESLAQDNPQADFIEMVTERCCVSRKTVYNWINGDSEPKEWQKETINEIKKEIANRKTTTS